MPINMDKIGEEFTLPEFDYNPQTIELYHIGIGAMELEYVYEKNFKVIPSFAVVPAFRILMASIGVAGVNPMMIVHGEQRIEILKQPIPWEAKTLTTGKIAHAYDKGKGALLVVEAETKDDKGEGLFKNTYSLFARGEGGFGGDRGPGPKNEAPDREPDHVVEFETLPFQNLIYRLSGDLNQRCWITRSVLRKRCIPGIRLSPRYGKSPTPGSLYRQRQATAGWSLQMRRPH
jgi:hypothetical protein